MFVQKCHLLCHKYDEIDTHKLSQSFMLEKYLTYIKILVTEITEYFLG